MIRYFHGQEYIATGLQPYRRRDGKLTNLVVWQSACPECGEAFTFTAPALKVKFEPNRHEEGISAGEGTRGADTIIAVLLSRMAERGFDGNRTTVQPAINAVLIRMREKGYANN
jgi:hypothetical protein